ncbi:MAG: cobalt-zinc-cadmium resistance protein [Planctomycetota bacterium]|nr:MAG: cobalt-zinc-cadmium resistance protein [Planctomycetota bacterium]
MLRCTGFRVAVACMAVCGCASYDEKPLRPDEVLDHIRRARMLEAPPAGSPQGTLTFSRAALLLRRHGPALAEARSEYKTALALAGVDTPFSNPGIEVGPAFGFGPDVLSRQVQPYGSLSFAIPLSARLARQNDVNKLAAEVARVEFAVRHREEYLALRRAFIRQALALRRLAVADEVGKLARDGAELGKRLVDAGLGTALDVAQLELEAARAESAGFDARLSKAESTGDMARMTGVSSEALGALADGALPDSVSPLPALDDLTALLVANHPALARLRSRYDEAEAQLRLEVSKQHPDLRFGLSGDSEVGERKYLIGLTVGIDIPIFDRNQQGVAVALERREEIRAKYEAACGEALARVERERARLEILTGRWDLRKGKVLTLARSQLDLAKKGLEAGAIDAIQGLEAERSFREAALEALEAEEAVREAWTDLEEAVGRPLYELPGEDPEGRPPEPAKENKNIESGRLDGASGPAKEA